MALECVANVSEGRDTGVIAQIAGAGGRAVLDVHSDVDHNRTVLTLAGDDPGSVENAVRDIARLTVDLLDLGRHSGVHPRIGVVDVVPFVPLPGSDIGEAISRRDSFARFAGGQLGVPCFLYGPERDLPSVRRGAFRDLAPDTGPSRPHATAGAIAVGAREVLVAYNVWLDTPDVELARRLAERIRSPKVRALGFATGGITQVSCNLVDPSTYGPADAFDEIAQMAGSLDVAVVRAELVGLVPRAVLLAVPEKRWSLLDLGQSSTIEGRLEGHCG